jgi:uncharacterized protein YicC (UPF0701 family)
MFEEIQFHLKQTYSAFEASEYNHGKRYDFLSTELNLIKVCNTVVEGLSFEPYEKCL